MFPNVGASRDFNDAQSLLQPYFGGDSILQQNNSNWSELDVPEIDAGDGACRRAADRRRAQRAPGARSTG